MVASTTAGKYGVKNTSGRIWASPHRAMVLATRQRIAKPIASDREGGENPCQPRLNSSINFAMYLSLHVISESKIWPSTGQNTRILRADGRNHAMPVATLRLARLKRGGDSGAGKAELHKTRGKRDGAAGWQGSGHHGGNERHRPAHRGDLCRRRREDRDCGAPRAGGRGAGKATGRGMPVPPDRRHRGR